MKRFLREVEDARLRQREEMLATTPGRSLPRGTDYNTGSGPNRPLLVSHREVLTARARAVARAVADGMTPAEAARELGLTERQARLALRRARVRP